jgi:hypothetical protein
MPGYILRGSRFYQCIENKDLSRAEWSEQIQISCDPEPTTTTVQPTTTSTITTMTTIEYMTSAEMDNIDDIPVELVKDYENEINVNYEPCKIDAASMLLSYANSNDAVPINTFEEFIFENATQGEYIDHGQTVSYHCINNMAAIYAAKCLNGTLFLQQSCHELRKEKSSCGPAPKIANGYNRFGSTVHGSKALYECLNGFELDVHNGELKCAHGEWVGKIPSCVKSNFYS